MTGNQLKGILDLCGLNQKQAAEVFGVCEATMSSQINKGDEAISKKLAKTALQHSLEHASQMLRDSTDRLIDITNRLIWETR